jgi:hypothetical protein
MADFSRLPGPNADLWDWQLVAACRGVDSSLFFHPEGERGAARSAREAAAKEVCMRCPVRAECAAHALAVREPYGVWGGLTEDEREAMLGRSRHRSSESRDGEGGHERARPGRSHAAASHRGHGADDDSDYRDDGDDGYGHSRYDHGSADGYRDGRDEQDHDFGYDRDDADLDSEALDRHPMDDLDDDAFADERDWDSLPARQR